MNYNIEKLFYYNENLTFIHDARNIYNIYKVEIHVEF